MNFSEEVKRSRTEQVADAVRRRIANRALQAGEQLPSIRSFAATMKVSNSTVVEAYDRLAAEGLIFARRGAGFFVGDVSQPLTLAEIGPRLDRAIDPFWVSRQSLDAHPDTVMPGCGWLPADWMPQAALRRAMRSLARAPDPVLSDYANTRGAPNLRQLLARQLADEDIDAEPGQIMLTPSGTQAMDLICRFMLRPGDTVLVDDPCYFNFHALLRAHQVKLVGIPYTPAGPDLDRFADALVRHAPRLYLTNSALHNPTGATISPKSAHKLLSLAANHGLLVIEDDIFAAFEPDPSPRFAVLDGFEHVIRVGSFSKTLSASLRCGYIAGRADRIDALIDLQVATNFGGPSAVATELVHAVLGDGSYRKHMAALRARLAKARSDTAARLRRLGIVPWIMPRGGFYLWCMLPDGADSAQLARAALVDGVVLAPGNVFSLSQSMARFMRFNVSQMNGPRVYDVLSNGLGTTGNR